MSMWVGQSELRRIKSQLGRNGLGSSGGVTPKCMATVEITNYEEWWLMLRK